MSRSRYLRTLSRRQGKSGAKLARRCAEAYPNGSYGARLRKMFAQKNRARRANRKPMVAV